MASSERRSNDGRARTPAPVPTPGPWKHGPIPVIGLVGGIGAGKSAAAREFERLGAFVIDADRVGHALLDQRPVRERVVARFGPQILARGEADAGSTAAAAAAEPAIDRPALGAIVFNDPAARKVLESIVHPRMRRTFEKAIARVIRRGEARAVVLDAAILYEAGWDSLCDRVVFVDAPRTVRLARLAAQRGWDEAALDARERAQWALVEKRGRADLVVDNDSVAEALGASVRRVWDSVLASPPARRRPAPRADRDAAANGNRRPPRRSSRPRGRT